MLLHSVTTYNVKRQRDFLQQRISLIVGAAYSTDLTQLGSTQVQLDPCLTVALLGGGR